MSSPLDEPCSVCGNTREFHETQGLVHSFNGKLSPPKREEQKESGQAGVDQFSGDPVLRLALVNKGVLTVDDLLVAREILSAAQASGEPAIATLKRRDHGTASGD